MRRCAAGGADAQSRRSGALTHVSGSGFQPLTPLRVAGTSGGAGSPRSMRVTAAAHSAVASTLYPPAGWVVVVCVGGLWGWGSEL